MADLIIRTTGEVLLGDMEVARITFSKPYCETDVAGEYVPESYAAQGWGSDDQDEYDALEEELDNATDALKFTRKALTLAHSIVLGVLPKFNWAAAELTEDEIALLKEAEVQIANALNKAGEVL